MVFLKKKATFAQIMGYTYVRAIIWVFFEKKNHLIDKIFVPKCVFITHKN